MNLGPAINTSFQDMGPSISNCENILYFHSDRLGGYGGFDLYSSDYVFGAWSAPQNLGPTVNTVSTEEWPSISSDGATLYFDSDRPGGRGLSDIWETSCALQTTITTNPAGLTITVDGNSCTAPQTFCWPSGSMHTIDVATPQSGGAGIQYIHSHWSDGGTKSHSITVPATSTTYTAFFTTQYLLTTNVCPPACGIPWPPCGTIAANPVGPWYNAGTTVTLTATAAATCLGVPGVPFSCWSGNLTGTTNPATIVMSAPMYVDAVFSTCPGGVRGAIVQGGCTIDVLDVLAVVNHILGIVPLVGAPLCRADCNANGAVDILDALGIVNCILGFSDCAPKVGISTARVWTPEISLEKSEIFELPLFIDAETDIAGAQFEFAFDPNKLTPGTPQVTERSGEMTMAANVTDGRLIVVIYDVDGKHIPAGSDPILTLPFTMVKSGKPGTESPLRFEQVLLGGSCQESIPVDIEPIRVKTDGLLPETWSLEQNYPNPFNPTTTISFALLHGGQNTFLTTLKIYDILGQEVRTLVNELVETGCYAVMWDGRDQYGNEVSSGVYFYRLTAAGITATRRMVLMK